MAVYPTRGRGGRYGTRGRGRGGGAWEGERYSTQTGYEYDKYEKKDRRQRRVSVI